MDYKDILIVVFICIVVILLAVVASFVINDDNDSKVVFIKNNNTTTLEDKNESSVTNTNSSVTNTNSSVTNTNNNLEVKKSSPSKVKQESQESSADESTPDVDSSGITREVANQYGYTYTEEHGGHYIGYNDRWDEENQCYHD